MERHKIFGLKYIGEGLLMISFIEAHQFNQRRVFLYDSENSSIFESEMSGTNNWKNSSFDNIRSHRGNESSHELHETDE